MIVMFEGTSAKEVCEDVNKFCKENNFVIASQSLSVFEKTLSDVAGNESHSPVYVLSIDAQPVPRMSSIGVPTSVIMR